jgi:hypothetical protein
VTACAGGAAARPKNRQSNDPVPLVSMGIRFVPHGVRALASADPR